MEGAFAFAGRRIALVAVSSLVIAAGATVADILLRNFFRTSLFGLNEYITLLVAITATTCLPFGLFAGAALKIDLVSGRLPDHWRTILNYLGNLLGAVLFMILAVSVWHHAANFGATNQTTVMTGLPLEPFFKVMSGAIFFGGVAFAVRAIADFHAILATTRTAVLAGVAVTLAVCVLVLTLLGVFGVDFLAGLTPSSPVLLASVIVAALFLLVLLAVPVGVAMGLAGLIGSAMLFDTKSATTLMGSEVSGFVVQESLSVLPFFLLMGAFAGIAGIGTDLYKLGQALLGHFRGGLAYASILACAGFGTLTGSSIATQMTIGRIAMKEMQDRDYSPALVSGTIAAGGTLGQLIPPSSALILFAIMTEESIGQLFIGAVIPGLLAVALYMLTILAWVTLRPGDIAIAPRGSFREVAVAAQGAWSVLVVLGLVLGGIYFGFFTDLEAGAVGTIGTFLIALVRGKLNVNGFWRTIGDATMSLAMIYSLLIGVTLLTFFFGVSGLPEAFVSFLNGFGLSPLGVILVLVMTYLVLGTVMDGFSMMLITIPIFVPIVHSLGYDPIWWGIMTLVCMEAGQISPPFGINIFVISSLDPRIRLGTVYAGCTPFFAATLIKIALLILFPALVTWLPGSM
ncbi:TRAP transporter large permease subunit [bacterium]|nr:TRAP transporter large permease subunit [bacterium]